MLAGCARIAALIQRTHQYLSAIVEEIATYLINSFGQLDEEEIG